MTRDFPKKNVDARASLSGKKIACRAFNSFIIVWNKREGPKFNNNALL